MVAGGMLVYVGEQDRAPPVEVAAGVAGAVAVGMGLYLWLRSSQQRTDGERVARRCGGWLARGVLIDAVAWTANAAPQGATPSALDRIIT